MLRTGLVSITFRKLSPPEIVALVARAGLDGIEWGGDIHVPHGDLKRAREVRVMTRDAGLASLAYGSYYRVSEPDMPPFEAVLDTAAELGAPLLRVWAGKRGSEQADEAYRARVADESCRIAEMAAPRGIVVAYEFHRNTLTDTADSARALLQAAGHPNLKTLWQPRVKTEMAEQLRDFEAVQPWLTNLHAFCWDFATNARLPLMQGEALWREVLKRTATMAGDHAALIEFVADDAPENFLRDAAALRQWTENAMAGSARSSWA